MCSSLEACYLSALHSGRLPAHLENQDWDGSAAPSAARPPSTDIAASTRFRTIEKEIKTDLPCETNIGASQTEAFRLSPQQRCAWRLQEKGALANALGILEIRGALNERALKSAIDKVIDRHEALRTVFRRAPGVLLPYQTILDQSAPIWRIHDLQTGSQAEQTREIKIQTAEERHVRFDLEHGPIVRVLLLILSEDRHLLVITMPAISSDRRSLLIIAREIANLCSNSTEFTPDDEVLQYAQYSAWQDDLLESDDQQASDGRVFWTKQEVDAHELPPLPFAKIPEMESVFTRATYTINVDSDFAVSIDRFAEKLEITPAVLLETLWAVLLSRLTGSDSVRLAHRCDGRSYSELEGIVGVLNKTLPTRFQVDPSKTLKLMLREANASIRDAAGWEEYYSVESSGMDCRPHCGFAFEDWSEFSVSQQFNIREVRAVTEPIELELTSIRRDSGISLEFEYDTGIYCEASVARLSNSYLSLLDAALEDPDAAVGSLPVLSASEKNQVLVEWNSTERIYPPAAGVHQLFEASAHAYRDSVAVIFEDEHITHGELNARANRLAHYLRARGVGPDVTVGLYLERSIEMVIGLLGILKAGGAYLPLDPALPAERLEWMLQDSGARLMVTSSGMLEIGIKPEVNVLLDRDAEAIANESDSDIESNVGGAHLTYVIYTSGSTGRPKGVGIEHAQLVNYVRGVSERLGLEAGMSYATVSTFAADLGNTTLFPSLCNGGTLHVVSGDRAMDNSKWREYFSKHRIDCLKIVPTHMSALLGIGDGNADALPRKVLIMGGEASSWELVERIGKLSPDLKVFNHYGPTETTVGVLTYPIEPGKRAEGSSTVPLGRPLPNSRIYLLNEYLQPVPVGVAGEVYIGGAGVGRGYLNQEELTAQRFVNELFAEPNPISKACPERSREIQNPKMYKTGDMARYLPDGNIEFLGRIDNQVKVRGYRIELGEIESVLNQHPGVREAVVLAREDTPGDKRLAAYVVSKNGALSSSDLKDHLREKLPEYMVPSAIVSLMSLPLTANGKVDRAALPAPEEAQEKNAYVGPRTETEGVLAGIWETLLGREKVSVEDNFFELGGHSLLVMQVISRVREEYGVDLPLRTLFDTPTIAGFAQSVDQAINALALEEEHELARMLAEIEMLTDEEARARLETSRTL